MNERIKELALQAGFQWTKFGLVARFPESNPEKFAELIVQECASQCLLTPIDYVLRGEVYANRIKQRFGVEE